MCDFGVPVRPPTLAMPLVTGLTDGILDRQYASVLVLPAVHGTDLLLRSINRSVPPGAWRAIYGRKAD